jgi:hypothetical protein
MLPANAAVTVSGSDTAAAGPGSAENAETETASDTIAARKGRGTLADIGADE